MHFRYVYICTQKSKYTTLTAGTIKAKVFEFQEKKDFTFLYKLLF
jgi:hypothetical protein